MELYKPEGQSLGFKVVGIDNPDKHLEGIFIQEIHDNGIAARYVSASHQFYLPGHCPLIGVTVNWAVNLSQLLLPLLAYYTLSPCHTHFANWWGKMDKVCVQAACQWHKSQPLAVLSHFRPQSLAEREDIVILHRHTVKPFHILANISHLCVSTKCVPDNWKKKCCCTRLPLYSSQVSQKKEPKEEEQESVECAPVVNCEPKCVALKVFCLFPCLWLSHLLAREPEKEIAPTRSLLDTHSRALAPLLLTYPGRHTESTITTRLSVDTHAQHTPNHRRVELLLFLCENHLYINWF